VDLAKARSAAERSDGASTSDTSGRVADADRVIAGLRPKFRACYQKGLNADPNLEGCTIIRARVASDGTVAAEVYVHAGLTPDVTACIAGVVRAASFSPPGGAGATLMVPVTFTQQH